VLLGPNGAGKSTLLNVIAGLIDYEGSVFFDNMPVDKVPANKRRIGYLFQELNLFPHLDVSANIAYGLRVQKKLSNEIKASVDEFLQIMKIIWIIVLLNISGLNLKYYRKNWVSLPFTLLTIFMRQKKWQRGLPYLIKVE
jgi:ABC-type molybdate transport system ATPase subunit